MGDECWDLALFAINALNIGVIVGVAIVFGLWRRQERAEVEIIRKLSRELRQAIKEIQGQEEAG